MAIFVNQTQGYFLLTNFKVMYSTLRAQSNLQEIFLDNYLAYIKFKSQQSQKLTIMLARNPYTRLISFFEDKFIRHPNFPTALRMKYSDGDGWQACQKLFFPYLNLDLRSPTATITAKLKNTSFSQFVTWLPEVYLADQHLSPQVSSIEFPISIKSLDDNLAPLKSFKTKLQIDRVIKLENLDRNYMKQNLNLDLSEDRNKNPQPKPLSDYFDSPQLLEIVNHLYRDDFQYFDYPQYDSVEQLLE